MQLRTKSIIVLIVLLLFLAFAITLVVTAQTILPTMSWKFDTVSSSLTNISEINLTLNGKDCTLRTEAWVGVEAITQPVEVCNASCKCGVNCPIVIKGVSLKNVTQSVKYACCEDKCVFVG